MLSIYHLTMGKQQACAMLLSHAAQCRRNISLIYTVRRGGCPANTAALTQYSTRQALQCLTLTRLVRAGTMQPLTAIVQAGLLC